MTSLTEQIEAQIQARTSVAPPGTKKAARSSPMANNANVSVWCQVAGRRTLMGLEQELKLRPQYHYHPSGHNAARAMALRLKGINPHFLPQIAGLRDQLSMWAGLDDKSKVRIGWQGTTIIIEIPKPPQYWKKVTIEAMQSRRYIRRGEIITLGLGMQDDPKRVNFRDPGTAHVFIVGQTRSGKTNAQMLMGWHLGTQTDPGHAQMLIIDVAKKGFKWRAFEQVQSLAHPIITDIEEAERVLACACQELERRAYSARIQPRLFLFIDELKALVEDSPLCAKYIARLASTGGEFGLHLILATQYPKTSWLGDHGGEIKDNVTTRLCGKVQDAASAANALGVAQSGAETLQGYGDFLLKTPDEMSRLTVAKIEDRHLESIPRTDTAHYLDLPHDDAVQNGPCVTPVEMGLAIKTQHDKVVQEGKIGQAIIAAGINKFRAMIGLHEGGSMVSEARGRKTQAAFLELYATLQEYFGPDWDGRIELGQIALEARD